MILITRATHPALFEAFERISHDCGRQAGHQNYAIPLTYAPRLAGMEESLKRLLTRHPDKFETLCIGEESDRQAIVGQYLLFDTDALLQRVFEEFA